MCFSLGFMFHFPWFQIWTLTISWNCLVLYLAFFVSNSSIYLFKDSQKLQCYFFPWDPCLHLGKSKIFGWNRIILFLDTFCFDFFVFVGGRKLFRSCMSALHCLNFFLFENPYRPLQYSLSGSFSEDWFPEGSLFAWTLKYFNCKGIFIEFSSSL